MTSRYAVAESIGTRREGNLDRLARALLWIGWLACVMLVVVSAWIGDDAYITLRTIDNFWNGYGLRWNVIERVQAYTHPLWLGLIASVYGVTREPYFTTLAVSAACTAGAIAIATLRVARTFAAAVLVCAILTSSRAFIDFSTSGLENPLSHLLLAAFLAEYWRARRLTCLSTLAGLCALNRLDTILLVAFPLLRVAWRERPLTAVRQLAFGFAPLIAWEAFTLLYYGSAVPNTAYAKLGTGVSREALVNQGLYFLRDACMTDPITPLVIAAGILLSLRRQSESVLVAVGGALSSIYVVGVGGDYMRGRFLTPAFFVSTLMLGRLASRQTPA